MQTHLAFLQGMSHSVFNMNYILPIIFYIFQILQTTSTTTSYFSSRLKESLFQAQTSRYLSEFEEIGRLGKGAYGKVFKVLFPKTTFLKANKLSIKCEVWKAVWLGGHDIVAFLQIKYIFFFLYHNFFSSSTTEMTTDSHE